jgi:hypothetical protein
MKAENAGYAGGCLSTSTSDWVLLAVVKEPTLQKNNKHSVHLINLAEDSKLAG